MSTFPIGRKLFDRTIDFVQRSLDLRTSRLNVLSSNIANAETPGYVSKDIPFKKMLERSIGNASTIGLNRTHPNHLPSYAGTDVELESVSEGVNIDQEMAKLSENNLRFQAEVQTLAKKLEHLKTTIIETGR